jgi:two-component system LytT family response regulator
MIKAIVIDDEAHIRQDIIDKIEAYFFKEIAVINQTDSVSKAVELIQKGEPDLLFLDIHLQDGTGFDILNLVTYKNFEIIFITGYDSHAIKAIKVGALDYLLKPVDEEEFKDAVAKALKNQNKEKNIEKFIEISSEYFKGAKKKRVILKTLDSVYAIYEDDILYCKSDGNYTTFYTQQLEKIVISKSLKKVEEILSDDIFIRCHQSYIVNKKKVLKFHKKGVLILKNEIKIPVSGRRKDYAINRIFN